MAENEPLPVQPPRRPDIWRVEGVKIKAQPNDEVAFRVGDKEFILSPGARVRFSIEMTVLPPATVDPRVQAPFPEAGEHRDPIRTHEVEEKQARLAAERKKRLTIDRMPNSEDFKDFLETTPGIHCSFSATMRLTGMTEQEAWEWMGNGKHPMPVTEGHWSRAREEFRRLYPKSEADAKIAAWNADKPNRDRRRRILDRDFKNAVNSGAIRNVIVEELEKPEIPLAKEDEWGKWLWTNSFGVRVSLVRNP